MVWNGEAVGTTMAPDSSTSFASGVVAVSFASEFCVYEAPTTPRPICMARSPLPDSLTVRCSPTVPPAPSRLNTSSAFARPSSSMMRAMERAVVS